MNSKINEIALPSTQAPFILYGGDDNSIHVRVLIEHETLWLSQNELTELFNTTKPNISMHLKNIFEEGELEEKTTVKDFLTVQNEGSRSVQRTLKFYNLDAIIALGYRVNSKRATQFRIWATHIYSKSSSKKASCSMMSA